MEPRELFEEVERKRIIEDACEVLKGGEKEKCIRILEKRTEKEEQKQVSDEE